MPPQGAACKQRSAIRNASAIVTRSSLSGYSVLFADGLPPDFLAAIDPASRQRSCGHLPVFWAWLAQILEANASCQKAVGHIQSWAATCGLAVPSSDTSSYCKARGRMSMEFLKDIHRRICRCLRQKAHVLMRLHQACVRALDWRKGKRISPHERLVSWKRPQQPAGSSMSREEWDALPGRIEVRLIKLSYENRAKEKGELVLVTTLTDHRKYDGIELADLYARRWDIELKLRDLKTTLGMEFFAVKSPAMVHKTLWMSLIAFNLIR